MFWIAIASVIWATYAALLGYAFGAAFEDDHTIAFLWPSGPHWHHGAHRAHPWARDRGGNDDADESDSEDVCVGRTVVGCSMIALVPVRDGVLPAGADEAIAECGGRVVLAGSAVDALPSTASPPTSGGVELGDVRRGAVDRSRWSRSWPNSPTTGDDRAARSPDGRDLAPRLAAALGRPARWRGATTVTPAVVYVARGGGLELHEIHADGPFVATLQPGVRGTEPFPGEPGVVDCPVGDEGAASGPDAVVVEVLPPDVRTMDLAEARRIVGGGAGLDAASRFGQLATVRRARSAV